MSLKYKGVPVPIPYGAGKRTRLEIRAARMRAGITEPYRLEPEDMPVLASRHQFPKLPTENQQVRIAIELLRLQEQKRLQVWIDGGRVRVAPFSHAMRPPGEVYPDGARQITWERAAEIVRRGGLE